MSHFKLNLFEQIYHRPSGITTLASFASKDFDFYTADKSWWFGKQQYWPGNPALRPVSVLLNRYVALALTS